MSDINAILKEFRPVKLDEMDSVNFMNRNDTKYLFNINSLPELLKSAASGYRILEINDERSFSYCTTYYDTPAYSLYYQHVTGKLGRNKIRVRTYESTGTSFLEVKNKTNKGKTVKSRIKRKTEAGITEGKGFDFISEVMPDCNPDDLRPMLTNRFIRVTLANFEVKERITIDFNVSFSVDGEKSICLPYLAIAEIKRDRNPGCSPFYREIKRMGIREASFSKYCVGMALLNDMPKSNTLKPRLLTLNKIKNEPGNTVIGGKRS